MSTLPSTRFALIQKHDGYSGHQEGPAIEDASLYLEEGDLPMPEPGPGQVLIRMRCASVNPSDLHFIKGEYGQPRTKGAAAGFEGCGDVVGAGAGAEKLMGQRVGFVATMAGAWSEYLVTDAAAVVPLHPDVSDENGAALVVNPLTAIAMVQIAEADGDCFVLSAATSQLGKLMIALARDKGLKTIALVRRDDAIAPLAELGATHILNVTKDDFASAFTALSAELKPRVFLDAVSDQTSETIFTLMPNKARWITYGKLSVAPPKLTQMGQFIFQSKQIEGFWLTRWMQTSDPAEVMKAGMEVQARYADGSWNTDYAIRLPLREVMSGLADATKLKDGKILIVP